jgi:hypothetical protein
MPRRQKTSVLDDLFELLMEIPWWAGPIVIFGVYAFCRWGYGWMLGAFSPENEVTKISTPIFSEVVVGLAPWVAGLAALVWVMALVKKAERRLDERKEPSPDASQPSPSPSRGTGRGMSSPPQSPATDAAVICPQCGSAMVLRTAKTGANAGSQFWGCSQFPGCRGTRKR